MAKLKLILIVTLLSTFGYATFNVYSTYAKVKKLEDKISQISNIECPKCNKCESIDEVLAEKIIKSDNHDIASIVALRVLEKKLVQSVAFANELELFKAINKDEYLNSKILQLKEFASTGIPNEIFQLELLDDYQLTLNETNNQNFSSQIIGDIIKIESKDKSSKKHELQDNIIEISEIKKLIQSKKFDLAVVKINNLNAKSPHPTLEQIIKNIEQISTINQALDEAWIYISLKNISQ